MRNLLLEESSVTLQLQHERLVLETKISDLSKERKLSVMHRKRSINEIDQLTADCYSELKEIYNALSIDLKEIINNTKEVLSVNDIKNETSKLYGVDLWLMMTDTRQRPVVEARQLVFRMVKKMHPTKTLASIGRIFNKDHSTVLHAERVINERIETGQLLIELPESWI